MGKYRAYPEYKDSGVEWLGEVPAHWEVNKLRRLTSKIGSGKTPSGGAEQYKSDGITFLRSQNIHDDGLRLDDVVYIDQDVDNLMPSSRVKTNDVLLNITGASISRTSIATPDIIPANVNQHVCILRPYKSKIDPLFLHAVLCSKGIKDHIFSLENGTSREGLNFQQIGNMPSPVPPLEEQTQIAAFLDHETAKIDRLIAKQEELIALLQEKRQAVISHAVTKGLAPDAPMKDSGVEWLGEVPAHWKVGKLKHQWCILDCKHITAEFTEDGFPLASIGEVQSHYIDLTNAKKTSQDYFNLLIQGKRKPKIGDLIFSRNATVGEASIVDSDEDFAMGQDVCLLRKVDDRNCDSEFLYFSLHSEHIASQLECLMIGATFKRINVEDINNLWIAYPPSNEQKNIGEKLNLAAEKIDKTILRSLEICSLLQERRTALISAAVTGKIDVRNTL